MKFPKWLRQNTACRQARWWAKDHGATWAWENCQCISWMLWAVFAWVDEFVPARERVSRRPTFDHLRKFLTPYFRFKPADDLCWSRTESVLSDHYAWYQDHHYGPPEDPTPEYMDMLEKLRAAFIVGPGPTIQPKR